MNKELYAGYEEEIRDYRLAFSRGCAYTAIGLILLGMGLDYGLYPQMQLLFGGVRIGVSILVFLIIMMMRTKWGEYHAQWLTFIWLLLPQIMITWMIARTEGATSLYYAGLHLAIFASGIALPFSLGENIIFSAVTIAMYVCACIVHPESFRLQGYFIVNSLFLLMSASVSAVCTYFNERARFMLFRLRTEVAHKNLQLEETNKSLGQIKGKMLQQEKMAAIGTLAAGLLHEINNPVNFCLMAVDLAMEEPVTKSSSLLVECLVDAKSGMKRVQHIVSDLKIFAYRNPEADSRGQPFMFEKALNSAARLTAHELHGIKVTRDLPVDNLVSGDEAAIIGVLINLLSNAALAMRNAATASPSIHISGVWKGARLFIYVRDNGPGIPQQNLTRVFEPFFTTREIGQGLGLGLSISYSVVERHGGVLLAESALGEWTEMTFDLPRAE
jgi:two-component system sensor histidine kinase PhcS